MLLKILKTTLAPFGLLLLVVIALFLARARFPFLRAVPLWVFLLIIGGVVAVWVLVLVLRWLAERRRAQAIENGIMQQAQTGLDQAAPAHRAQIEELQEKLTHALAQLKQGPGGKKALYTLPWYMIIGPPAIGKTTVIKNSGLSFPGMSRAEAMKGAGGTRNCDWWFTSEAVLLDTAGRYASGLDRSETEREWFAFLDLLQDYRKHGPIDGLILGYSIEDIYEQDEHQLIDGEKGAREMRRRMDEILDHLGWTFPVYILFTKCDLIAGFTDYFSSLPPSERYQVLGAVFEPDPTGNQAAAERFSGEFSTLLGNLREIRPRRMSSVSQSENWGRVFVFPEEFASLQSKMELFIETLFEANPYRKDVPIFRGTYFSSGMREGKPFDLVMEKIQARLGGQPATDLVEEQEREEGAFFVRDLFARVLRADRNLVRLTGSAARRRTRISLAISSVFAALAIIGCLSVGLSYSRLQDRMDTTAGRADELLDTSQARSAVEELAMLEQLRRQVSSDWRSFPLTAADKVRVAARELYFTAISERILAPAEKGLSRRLAQAMRLDGAEVRQTLRAELMLLMPQERERIGWDAGDLADALAGYVLRDDATDEVARQHLTSLVEEFLAMGRPLPGVERQFELRSGSRRLAASHQAAEFYRDVVERAGDEAPSLGLEDLVEAGFLLRSPVTIRPAFTRAGWERSVDPAIRSAPAMVEADNALIALAGGEPTAQPPSAEELLEFYERQYIHEWTEFLESVSFRSYLGCRDYREDLRKLRLSGPSPLFNLLRNAAATAELDASLLEPGSPSAAAASAINEDLAPLLALVHDGEGHTARLEEYAVELRAVHEEVDACGEDATYAVNQGNLRSATRWLEDFAFSHGHTPVAEALTELLGRPVEIADEVISNVAGERARQDLAETWRKLVGDQRSALRGAYPFAPGADEAIDPRAVVEFFGPGGRLAEFAEYARSSSARHGRAVDRALAAAAEIRRELDMTDQAFSAQFTMVPLEVRPLDTLRGENNLRIIDTVRLIINGEELVWRFMDASKTFTWRSDDENLDCAVVLESTDPREEITSIRRGGTAWSICQLFDRARIAPDPEQTDAYRVVWTFPDSDVEVAFRMTTRENVEPFFKAGSRFRQFSLPSGVFDQ